MDDIVYAASSLPALDRLVIHAAALRIPLPISEDPEPLFGEEAEAYLSVLGGVLSRLKVLELVGFSAITPLVTILLRSTNISFLKIYKYRAPELSDSEAASSAIALSQALQGLKKISTLLLYDATPLLRFLADNNQLDQWTSRLIGVHSEEQATELPRAYSESFSLSIELRRLIFTPSALISSRTFAERK